MPGLTRPMGPEATCAALVVKLKGKTTWSETALRKVVCSEVVARSVGEAFASKLNATFLAGRR